MVVIGSGPGIIVVLDHLKTANESIPKRLAADESFQAKEFDTQRNTRMWTRSTRQRQWRNDPEEGKQGSLPRSLSGAGSVAEKRIETTR